ncbi:MAG TPA: hypothetical protein VIH06_14230, partial [Ilumatobacteraceae bacterium]
TEHRRLAGAVRSHQADEAARQSDREIVECRYTGVSLGEGIDAEKGFGEDDAAEFVTPPRSRPLNRRN